MSDFDKRFETYRKEVEEAVQNYSDSLFYDPPILRDSMRYALSGGGKRIRPVLCLAAADLVGVERERIMPLALSIELIHNYSLIHDDIMDGDDFRRGKPTVQKKFGTSNALLAGDALLNDAYLNILSHCTSFPRDIYACLTIASCAGGDGMICGQSADLLHEGDEKANAETVYFINENKTAKLIAAACAVPGHVVGNYYSSLYRYGLNLGMLFQLTDDLLDYESYGSDAKRKKCTAVSVCGPEGCERLKQEYVEGALDALSEIDRDTSFFKDFVKYVEERKS